MSAGDIDDRLGPVGELSRLRRKFPQLNQYLQTVDSLEIHRATIPFGAGISKYGQRPYVDERLDLEFDGKNVAVCLRAHECTEWALRKWADIGVDYDFDPRGHRLANRAEFEELARLHGSADEDELWDAYNEFLDPQLRKLEHAPLTNVPPDLALYPYESDEKMMERLREAMR